MAGLSNITLAVRANISNFQKRLKVAEKKVQAFSRKMANTGANMSRNVTVPLGIAGGAALKAASDYEDAVTEIEKVSNKETASKLEGQIRSMAESIPLAQSELADLAADAARFGVKGSDNVAKFTRTVAQMSATTDLAAKEAGKALAKIADQADIPQENIDKLGSTIVRLGDSMATSQSEIVDAMSRGTIAARNFGLQGETIAGLAARVNEVSESGERAGTRIKRLFQELQEPKKVQKVANALGMTAQQFTKMRNESPEKALMAVVEAAGQSGEAGAEMANIFATSSRAALRGLASDTEGLSEALNKAGDEFQEPTELSRQFNKEQKKFSSQLQIALNKLRNLGITIGEMLMPHVLKLIGKIKSAIGFFQGLSKSTQETILAMAGIAAAAGPLMFVLGKIGPMAFSAFSTVVSAARMAARGITLAMTSTGVGLLVVAVGAAATAIIAQWEKIRNYFSSNGIGTIFQDSLEVLKKVGETIVGAVQIIWQNLKRIFENNKETITTVMTKIGKAFKTIGELIWINFKTTFSALLTVIGTVVQAFKKFFGFLIDLFEGDIKGALKNLKGLFDTIFVGILNIVQKAIVGILKMVKNLASKFSDDMAEGVQDGIDAVKGFGDEIKENLNLEETDKKVESVAGGFGKLKEMIKAARKEGKGAFDFDFGSGGSGGSGGGGSGPESKKDTRNNEGLDSDESSRAGPEKAGTIDNIDMSGAKRQLKKDKKLQEKRRQEQVKQNKEIAGTAADFASKIQQGANGAKGAISGIGKQIANSVAPGIGKAVGPVFSLLGQSTNKLRSQIQSFAKAIPKVITLIIKNVPVLIQEILKGVPLIINGLIKGIPFIVKGLIKGIPLVIKEMVLLIPRMVEDIFNIDLGIGSSQTRPSKGGPGKELKASVSGDEMQFALDEDKNVKERMGQEGG